MEIMARSEAIRRREHLFYTGKPCKYGHLTVRYTKNGACKDCVNPKFETQNTARGNARRRMVLQGFVIHESTLGLFNTKALALAQQHEPTLRAPDINSGRRPVAGNNGFSNHIFRIFPEDREALQLYETTLKSLLTS